MQTSPSCFTHVKKNKQHTNGHKLINYRFNPIIGSNVEQTRTHNTTPLSLHPARSSLTALGPRPDTSRRVPLPPSPPEVGVAVQALAPPPSSGSATPPPSTGTATRHAARRRPIACSRKNRMPGSVTRTTSPPPLPSKLIRQI